MSRIAIIGAGIGGLALGSQLARSHDVTVFEKGRGVGGRMASRHAGAFSFDHGAQYFTVRDPRFAALLAPLIAAGAVAPWTGQIADIANGAVQALKAPRDIHYVGVPNMNSFAKSLVAGLTLRTGVDIAPLPGRKNAGWALLDTSGAAQGVFDWVISTTTAHQTMALFDRHAPHSGPLATTEMLPCYALMLGFEHGLDLAWVAARISDSPIEWIGVNSSKPGRYPDVTTLVVHSSSAWAMEHLDQESEQLADLLAAALQDATGIDPAQAAFRTIHRWRSAKRADGTNYPPYLDVENGLAATGDWACGSRVENVVLSALALGDAINAR